MDIQKLKRVLVELPRRHNFEFSDAARLDIRRALFLAASVDGRYENVLHFETERQKERQQRGGLPDASHPNRSCGRKFMKGEPVHRCVTCGLDESSGLCSECFNAEQHEGHDVLVSTCLRDNGGICDCGDAQVWKTQPVCKHQHVAETPDSQVPAELKHAFYTVFSIVLDYTVDVMSMSSPLSSSPTTSYSPTQKASKNLSPGKYFAHDKPSSKEFLLLYNDQNRQYRDAVQRITSTTNKVVDFAKMVADEVNSNGRAKVSSSTNLLELMASKKILEATGLPASIRTARDIFREEICAEIIKWLTEVTSGPIMGNYNFTRDLLSKAFCSPWDCGVASISDADNGLDLDKIPNIAFQERSCCDSVKQNSKNWETEPKKWNIDQELANQCSYNASFSINDEMQKSFHGSRFQYLLFFDTRFWKSIRIELHNLINSVLTTNRKFRSLVCCQYVDIYPTLLESFLLYDREPEYSCMTSLTSQILTPPSNATMIIEHGDLTRFLAAAYGYLTSLIVLRPCDVDPKKELSISAFKNRRVGQIFFDICCILSKTTNYNNVLSEMLINQVCDVLQLFQGKPILKREAHEHVEYENNDYGLQFNIYSVISSLSDMVAKSFLKAPIECSNQLISVVMERMIELYNDETLILFEDRDFSKYDMEVISTLEGSQEVTFFKVHNGKMSFLHPLHAFITWIIQYSRMKTLQIEPSLSDELQVYLIEYPLRVIVMLSQIKIGLWVRNGFSIRTQLHIYKSSGIRESGYKRDLYMLQLLASLCSSKFFLTTVFERWSLQNWLREDFGNHDDYEESILPLMVEECLLFFINLLSETTYLVDPEKMVENRISREIIHALCFGPLSFSKLSFEIPDFLVHEKPFDIVLKKITTFIPPKDINGTGVYKLKDQYFDQVDPYYIHYSSNKREDAEKLITSKIGKHSYVKPHLTPLNDTIFKDLFRLTSSKIFVQFLKSTLKYIDNEGISKTETMLNFTLHLIHISIEGYELSYSLKFGENFWSELTADHNEPFYYESVGSLLYKFLRDDAFDVFHSKIRAIFEALKSKNIEVNGYLKEQVQKFDPLVLSFDFLEKSNRDESEFEKKKRLAKERRLKIMEKFKKQQSQFVAKNNIEDLSPSDTDMDDACESKYWKYPEEHCILCQMPKSSDSFFGVIANILPSHSSRNIPFSDNFWVLKAFSDSNGLDSRESVEPSEKLENAFKEVKRQNVIGPAFPCNKTSCTEYRTVASSCGHGMHYSCYLSYLESSRNRQTQITRTVPEDFENQEFICPLCKSLGNVLIPILWTCNNNPLYDWLQCSDDWYEGFERLKNSSITDPKIVNSFIDDLVTEVKSSLKQQYRSLVLPDEIERPLKELFKLIKNKASEVSQPYFREFLNRLLTDTIDSIETSLRGSLTMESIVVNQLSSQMISSLRTLAEFQKTTLASAAYKQQHSGLKSEFSVKVGDELLAKLSFLSSDRVFEVVDEIDFFQFLASCIKTKDIPENSIYRLCYVGQTIQSLATILAQIRDESFDGDLGLFDLPLIRMSDSSRFNILGLTRQIRDNHPLFDNLSDEVFENELFPDVLFTMLVRSITPFLRKVAILSFASCGNTSNVDLDFGKEPSEVLRLTKYLNLPSVQELLELFSRPDTVETSKFKSFIKYIQTTDNDLNFSKLEYPGVVRLIDIPKRLDDIFLKLLYPANGHKPLTTFDPAICLHCGSILNLQKSSNGEIQGECNIHYTKECINDVGIFLLPKHGSILLLHKGNGSFYPAPYIDSHGEYDSDIKQGQILTLSEEKYDHFIRQMWLQHGIPNSITRKLEGTLDIGGWETL